MQMTMKVMNPMHKQGTLIQDTFPLKIMRSERIMSEDINGNKVPRLRIGGQFQKASSPNANGRIYPANVLNAAVEDLQEHIKSRRILGEFDHPPDAKIHLDRVSHLITKLWMEGDTVFGECEVLENTQHGSQLKALLESNVNIGISSRGVGDMEATIYEGEEYYQVLPGYSFVTFDIVAEPSVHGSYMSVLESKDNLRKRNRRGDYELKTVAEVRNILKGLC
jgi:hypothetical protein